MADSQHAPPPQDMPSYAHPIGHQEHLNAHAPPPHNAQPYVYPTSNGPEHYAPSQQYQQPAYQQFPPPPPPPPASKPNSHAFVDNNRSMLVYAAFGLALLSFLFQIFILSIVGNMHSRIFG